MSNFELIDDYLANRLTEPDKKAFEQQLEGDPALKEELEFQQVVVQGVQKARAIELKSMLNNVPLGGSPWAGAKLAAAVVSAGVVATSLYLYFQNPDESVTTPTQKQEVTESPVDKSIEPSANASADLKDNSSKSEQPLKEKASNQKEKKTPIPVRKPDIQVVDPSEELTTTEEKSEVTGTNHANIAASKMEVITGNADKKHNFHYQFVQGKLLLFGPFDKSLYEILEIHGEDHAVFLFYKENYYLLDEKQSKIKSLEAIRDGLLLKKLKEYRGQ